MTVRARWVPTHCLRGEAPQPVMLITDADGTVVFHDGFAPSVRMASEIFHKLYIPIADYGKRPRAAKKASKKNKLLKALETGGPLPGAVALANRGKKKPPRRPPNATDFFI